MTEFVPDPGSSSETIRDFPIIDLAAEREKLRLRDLRWRKSPRVIAAMERLMEARGIQLDGNTAPEREQVAFYQACCLLMRIDAADPLRQPASPLKWEP